jgi:L-ascorbate metabolism protein UlaG (beta-lactamase superfamily)
MMAMLLAVFLLLLIYIGYRYWYYLKSLPQPAPRPLRHRPRPDRWPSDEVTITWVGHATLLINLYGTRILTDPVLGERVGLSLGPVQIGPKRFVPPALTTEEIGPVDLILLSHAHFDHFDLPTLKRLASDRTHVITALHTSHLLKRLPFQSVQELGGTDALELDGGLRITAVPVRHWGNRLPWNTNYGYTGYLIEKNGVRLFFAGDTAYTPTLRDLRKAGPIDVAFMPIGAYKPDAFQANHCTPEQSWQMFLDTGARWMAPIHWRTFVLSYEPVDEPMKRLLQAAGSDENRIILREQGMEFRLPPCPDQVLSIKRRGMQLSR